MKLETSRAHFLTFLGLRFYTCKMTEIGQDNQGYPVGGRHKVTDPLLIKEEMLVTEWQLTRIIMFWPWTILCQCIYTHILGTGHTCLGCGEPE